MTDPANPPPGNRIPGTASNRQSGFEIFALFQVSLSDTLSLDFIELIIYYGP